MHVGLHSAGVATACHALRIIANVQCIKAAIRGPLAAMQLITIIPPGRQDEPSWPFPGPWEGGFVKVLA